MSYAIVKSARLWPFAWIGRVLDAVIAAAGAYAEIRQAARERHELLLLGERELHDLGISRADAIREANRPLWRRRA